MSFDANRGVHISTGPGIVAHVSGLTAYAEGDEPQLNTLVARLNALAGEPWTEVVRALTAEITEVGYDDHPKLACVSVESEKVAAFVFGDTTLSLIIDDGETLLDGAESSTWIDVTLHGAVKKVMAGAQSSSPIVGVLRDGVVPAGGFMLDTSGPMPASGRWVDEMKQEPETVAEPEPQAEAVATPSIEAPFAAPVIEPGPEADALLKDTPAPEESIEPMPAPVAEDAGLPDTDREDSDLEETSLEDTETEPTSELTQESEDEPEPEDPSTEAGASTGVAVGAASIAAAGLFTRLDQRINPADNEIEPPTPVADNEPEIDPNSSVFDRPDLIDAQDHDDSTTEEADYDIADAPKAFANPNETESSPPAEPSPIASLTQTRPQIRGVRCLSGHLTKPDGSPCMTCGARIDPDVDEEKGDRPALGTLNFDDGAMLNIERPAVIGSDVPHGYVVSDEPATIIRLDDGEGGVHSVHMEMRLSGWNVEIVDMGSEGGTYTAASGDRQTRTKLRSGQSVALESGMTIEAGRRSFTYTVGPTPPTD